MDHKAFCLHQKQLIEQAKWLEGVRTGVDPGPDFVAKWVEENAEKYRQEYNECFKELIQKTASECMNRLREKVPGVSEELWLYVLETIIQEFTKVWMVELASSEDEDKKRHLEEI